MSTIGRFPEFSVRTPDILESLHFYKTLGFVGLAASLIVQRIVASQASILP